MVATIHDMESEHTATEISEAKPARTKKSKKKLLFGSLILAAVLIGAGFWTWHAMQPKSLMPKDISSQITTFTPYFYFDEVPAGYELSKSRVEKEFGVALFSLTKLGRPAVTLSEQPLSSGLDPNQLLKGGESVRGAAQPATINSVEGRYVGIMVDTKSKTMILLNTTNDAEKEDLKDLLKGLKPVK
jgi:hypothetical protein